MSRKEVVQDDLWDLKAAIARAVARGSAPTLRKLELEILEEFGYPPEQEVIDYFLGLLAPKRRHTGASSATPEQLLAQSMARSPQPTILKFRQAFQAKFGRPPGEEQIQYFLAQLEEKKKQVSPEEFANQMAMQPDMTVLKFRQAFAARFGHEPDEALTTRFLELLQEQRDSSRSASADEAYQSKVNFAITIAHGLVPTVLKFRQAFVKAYGEQPSEEIIDIFIKHLPQKG